MDNNFTEIMSKRTSEDLIKIITVEKDSYQPAAIEAAEKEIQKRNIEVSKIDQIKTAHEQLAVREKQIENDKVNALTRFIHLIVDTITWLVIATILGMMLQPLFKLEVLNENLIGYSVLIISFFGYYIIMETKYQKTLGKFITKTKVTTKTGEKPKQRDIVIRTAGRLLPFDRVSFLFTSNGIHDYVSGTTVAKETLSDAA